MTGPVAGLLPDTVVTEQTIGELPGDLWPQEAAHVAAAAAGRRGEFATGRACARRALGRLGVAPVALPPGDRGAPTWPAGVVGSLTHCRGLTAAAVARSVDVAAIGIDAEPHAPLPDGVPEVVASPSEREHLAELAAAHPTVAWDRLLFSAKESVYKVWSPATGLWLDFEQVEVRLEPDGRFGARLRRPGLVLRGRPVELLPGRWALDAGHLVTAIAVVG